MKVTENNALQDVERLREKIAIEEQAMAALKQQSDDYMVQAQHYEKQANSLKKQLKGYEDIANSFKAQSESFATQAAKRRDKLEELRKQEQSFNSAN